MDVTMGNWTLAQAGTAVTPPGMPGATVGPATGGVAPTTTGTGAPGTGQPLPPPGPASPGGMGSFMWIILAMFLVLMLTQVMGARKEKKKQQAMMDSLKRNDRVQTVGGMIGTVVEIADKEVVLRMEEGRVRFVRTAIQTILTPAKSGASVESKPDAKALAS